MNYTVAWEKSAEDDLATVWMGAANRDAVTDAAAEVESWLADAPLTHGESRRSSVHRIAFCQPIGVEYEVIEDDKRVIVWAVFIVS